MSTVERAYALSDLHLGNPLNYLRTGTPAFTQNLQATGDLFNALGPADEIILNGDIFELALAGHDEICRDARAFFNLLAEMNHFQRIIFVPGNHDHHFWVSQAEQVHIYGKIKTHTPPPGHFKYPCCFIDERFSSTDENVPCDILIQHFWPDGKSRPEFVMKYPHHLIEIPQPDGQRMPYLITHGHFLENRFKPVNYLIEPAHLEELEAFNNFWLESFNYHWGHAGRFSDNVRRIEDGYRLGEAEAREAAQKVLDEIQVNLRRKLKLNLIHSILLKWGMKLLLKKMPLKGGSPLRNQAIDAEIKQRITDYITKYVIQRYIAGKSEEYFFPGDGDIPKPFTFIFGHTHRPIAGADSPEITIAYQKYSLANTGGWLRIEEPGAIPGATAGVLIIDQTGTSWKSLEGKLV